MARLLLDKEASSIFQNILHPDIDLQHLSLCASGLFPSLLPARVLVLLFPLTQHLQVSSTSTQHSLSFSRQSRRKFFVQLCLFDQFRFLGSDGSGTFLGNARRRGFGSRRL